MRVPRISQSYEDLVKFVARQTRVSQTAVATKLIEDPTTPPVADGIV
jgi:hypothetical protein